MQSVVRVSQSRAIDSKFGTHDLSRVQFDGRATSPPQTRKHPLRIEMRVSPGDALSP
jgi:hypothetical protein